MTQQSNGSVIFLKINIIYIIYHTLYVLNGSLALWIVIVPVVVAQRCSLCSWNNWKKILVPTNRAYVVIFIDSNQCVLKHERQIRVPAIILVCSWLVSAKNQENQEKILTRKKKKKLAYWMWTGCQTLYPKQKYVIWTTDEFAEANIWIFWTDLQLDIKISLLISLHYFFSQLWDVVASIGLTSNVEIVIYF